MIFFFFFFNDTATTEIYTLSLHDALPIFRVRRVLTGELLDQPHRHLGRDPLARRSEEHTSELQSQSNLVCRLLLEKKKKDTDFRLLASAAYVSRRGVNCTRPSSDSAACPC